MILSEPMPGGGGSPLDNLVPTLLEVARLRATLEIQFQPESEMQHRLAWLARDYLEAKGYENVSQRPDLFIMQPAAEPQKGD